MRVRRSSDTDTPRIRLSLTGARPKAWCLLIHVELSLSLSHTDTPRIRTRYYLGGSRGGGGRGGCGHAPHVRPALSLGKKPSLDAW